LISFDTRVAEALLASEAFGRLVLVLWVKKDRRPFPDDLGCPVVSLMNITLRARDSVAFERVYYLVSSLGIHERFVSAICDRMSLVCRVEGEILAGNLAGIVDRVEMLLNISHLLVDDLRASFAQINPLKSFAQMLDSLSTAIMRHSGDCLPVLLDPLHLLIDMAEAWRAPISNWSKLLHGGLWGTAVRVLGSISAKGDVEKGLLVLQKVARYTAHRPIVTAMRRVGLPPDALKSLKSNRSSLFSACDSFLREVYDRQLVGQSLSKRSTRVCDNWAVRSSSPSRSLQTPNPHFLSTLSVPLFHHDFLRFQGMLRMQDHGVLQ
jgi:hypothetical protein